MIRLINEGVEICHGIVSQHQLFYIFNFLRHSFLQLSLYINMAKGEMDRNLERVAKEANNRRLSVVPDPRIDNDGPVDSPWTIASTTHFQEWAEKSPQKLFEYLQQIRLDRDVFFEVAKGYRKLQDENRELRAAKAPSPKSDASEQVVAVREKRLSSKLPDPPTFTDGVDPTWEDWLSKIDRKLLVNADHYPSGEAEIAYVLLRLGGKAAAFTANRSRRYATNYYTSAEDLFTHLASAFEETNRAAKAKHEYDNCFMGTMSFRDFFAEFSRLGDTAGLGENHLQGDIIGRLSKLLFKAVQTYFLDYQTPMSEIRAYCIKWDDVEEVSRRKNAVEKTKRLLAKDIRKSYGTGLVTETTSKKSYGMAETPSKTSIFVKKEDAQPVCFHCGEPGHKKLDCPDLKKTGGNGAHVRVLEKGSESDSDDVYSTADSGNE